VFLHSVKPGPANQSYGLQVAALAGVPSDVIRRARAFLRVLESQKPAAQEHPQGQLPLDAADHEEEALRKAIAELEPDALSPREALEALYRLKRLVE
jgi:DNA mismatch repair protein MutS